MATGKLSDYLEDELLDHALKTGAYGVPANIYVALSTADPTDDGSGTAEPAGGAYARVQVNTWHAASARAVTNDGQIDFPECTVSWGTITHWAIYDADTAGNMLAYGALAGNVLVQVGDNCWFADAGISVAWSSGAIATYLANKLLDHVFKTTAYTPETNLYVALSTADPTDDGSGLTEPLTASAYARKVCNSWDAASAGASANTGAVTYDAATDSWGTVTHCAITNNGTRAAGDILFYGSLTASRGVGTGDVASFAAGDLDITLD